MVSFLVKFLVRVFLVVFVVVLMVMAICFGIVLTLLSGAGDGSPWAVSADNAAVYMLESALGSYSSDIFQGLDVPQSVDGDSAADRLPPSPDVWTDGSLVRDEVSGSAWAGAGVYARLHADNWRYRRWGHFDDLGLTPDGLSSSCLGSCSLPGPLQTVQRAEFWGVVLALQATNAVHLGVDSLNVVGHVGRLLNGLSSVRSLEHVDDGDLIILIRKLLSIRGEGTVCISKVKGHADESLVRSGQVRALDRFGNSRADDAAELGRRRVWPDVADARRNLSGVCRLWYPVVLLLHRFFIAISRAVVNCDDSSGLAPHPLVPERRRIADVVRDVALLPGLLHLWDSGWVSVPPVIITAEDVCLWPYSVDILVKLVTFSGSLHWPSAGGDLGPGGISYVERLILYELWAGERFQFEKAVPRFKRVDRPISVSADPFGTGIDIRRSCTLLGTMLRALCVLSGGLGRFLPCAIGANHSRLRHIGWVKSGHRLTSRLVRLLVIGSLMSCFFSLVTLLGLGVLCCVGLCL